MSAAIQPPGGLRLGLFPVEVKADDILTEAGLWQSQANRGRLLSGKSSTIQSSTLTDIPRNLNRCCSIICERWAARARWIACWPCLIVRLLFAGISSHLRSGAISVRYGLISGSIQPPIL